MAGNTSTLGLALTIQQPPARTNDEIARAIQQAMEAREQAQKQAEAAQRDAQDARNEARDQAREAAREAQQEIQQARREIEQAIRQARIAGGGAGGGAAGTTVQFPPFPGGPQIPEGAVIISVAFFVMCAVIAVGLPIARAFSRRMDRRNTAPATADSETRARLERIENAVDAIAVEVERISEGQRFTTKILGDMRALPQPDPSVALPDRGAVPISRAREAR